MIKMQKQSNEHTTDVSYKQYLRGLYCSYMLKMY